MGNNNMMGINDWLNVANSAGAIGATIDRKRREQRVETEQDRQKLIQDQSSQAFNYFIENPQAIDAIDNPEKQTAKMSSLSVVAGIPEKRPRMPIEDFSPEAIAKARLAAMAYLTNKQQLSNEGMRQTALKAKENYGLFVKTLSQAKALLASGDEATARQTFIDGYNKYYPDGYKISQNEEGEFTMASPFGNEKTIGQVNFEQILNEISGSPDLAKNFPRAAQMTKSAITKKNQELREPESATRLYGPDGKEYFMYTQIDPKTYDHEQLIWDLPWGTPGARSLTMGEIKNIDFKTAESRKLDYTESYHQGRGGKASATEKETPATKNYGKIATSVMSNTRNAGLSDEEMKAEIDKQFKMAYPGVEIPGAIETAGQDQGMLDYFRGAEESFWNNGSQEKSTQGTGAIETAQTQQSAPIAGTEKVIPAEPGVKLPPPAQYKGKKATVEIDGVEVPIHSDGVNWIKSQTNEIVDETGKVLGKKEKLTTPATQYSGSSH